MCRPGVSDIPWVTDTSLVLHGTPCIEGANCCPNFEFYLTHAISKLRSPNLLYKTKDFAMNSIWFLATYLFNSIWFHHWSSNKSESSGLISFFYLILSSNLLFYHLTYYSHVHLFNHTLIIGFLPTYENLNQNPSVTPKVQTSSCSRPLPSSGLYVSHCQGSYHRDSLVVPCLLASLASGLYKVVPRWTSFPYSGLAPCVCQSQCKYHSSLSFLTWLAKGKPLLLLCCLRVLSTEILCSHGIYVKVFT